MKNFERTLALYDYAFPPESIATAPASPRDSARLLVYDRKTKRVTTDTFSNIGTYLPTGSVLVFNKTKVFPARLRLKKESGGAVAVLYLSASEKGIHVLANRPLKTGAILRLNARLSFTVAAKKEKGYVLKPSFAIRDIKKILKQHGETPLPPYIKNTPLPKQALKREYQTVYASAGFSVAAPTAGLHFTRKLLSRLKAAGITTVFVTLNVNLGTFAPLSPENLASGVLHTEWYSIESSAAKIINRATAAGRPIIAVGTTVVRTLESAAHGGRLERLSGDTSLFIAPGYRFSITSGIITNFHVPTSSLLMLVSAFAGRKQTLSLYSRAIKQGFRLFSFGDGMLIT